MKAYFVLFVVVCNVISSVIRIIHESDKKKRITRKEEEERKVWKIVNYITIAALLFSLIDFDWFSSTLEMSIWLCAIAVFVLWMLCADGAMNGVRNRASHVTNLSLNVIVLLMCGLFAMKLFVEDDMFELKDTNTNRFKKAMRRRATPTSTQSLQALDEKYMPYSVKSLKTPGGKHPYLESNSLQAGAQAGVQAPSLSEVRRWGKWKTPGKKLKPKKQTFAPSAQAIDDMGSAPSLSAVRKWGKWQDPASMAGAAASPRSAGGSPRSAGGSPRSARKSALSAGIDEHPSAQISPVYGPEEPNMAWRAAGYVGDKIQGAKDYLGRWAEDQFITG